MEQEEALKLDLGSFDFTPDWAKKAPGSVLSAPRNTPREDRKSVDEKRPAGVDKPFGDRKPYGERKSFGDRRPYGERKPSGDRKPYGDRKPFGDRKPRFEDRPKPLAVEVKVLPDTKALGTIIRKLQSDFHAYKLKDLAYFFLDNPSAVLLKIVPKPVDAGAERVTFYQCKACGFASTSRDDVVAHILTAHLGDYYDSKEVDVEPPKGNFNCVAKCGLSGVLLGPPNVHEFNSVVREMIRTRYPEMSEQQYRAHIEMIRDADQIEAWRQSTTKRTMFFRKGTADQEGAVALTREQAEGEFRRTILDNMLDTPKNLMITADVAMQSPVKPLVWAVRDAVEQQRRTPYDMCFALRGAFHHRKMQFFRANDSRGPEFVIGHELKAFDVEHAIPELAKVAKFVAENPCCDKSELALDIEAEKHLQWLASTGHIIAFTNGVYSAVEKFPKYGPQWKKRPAAQAESKSKCEGEGEVESKSKCEGEVEPKVEEEKKDEAAAQLAE